MFPKKMREKGTRVVLANGSPMTKSVEFTILFRESECNYVYECAYISPGAWGLTYSLSTAVESLISTAVLNNLNGGLINAVL